MTEDDVLNAIGNKFTLECIVNKPILELYISAYNKRISHHLDEGLELTKEEYNFLGIAEQVEPMFIISDFQKIKMENYKKNKVCKC